MFYDLFSDKHSALFLYNALSKTDNDEAGSLEIVALSDVIYMHRKNDVSGDSLPDAMDKAIDRCTREEVLKEYLLKKKSEIKLMLPTEFERNCLRKRCEKKARID